MVIIFYGRPIHLEKEVISDALDNFCYIAHRMGIRFCFSCCRWTYTYSACISSDFTDLQFVRWTKKPLAAMFKNGCAGYFPAQPFFCGDFYLYRFNSSWSKRLNSYPCPRASSMIFAKASVLSLDMACSRITAPG
jgi:hypothetical protein